MSKVKSKDVPVFRRDWLKLAAKDGLDILMLKTLLAKAPLERLQCFKRNTTLLEHIPFSSGCTGSCLDLVMITSLLAIAKVPAKALDLASSETVCAYELCVLILLCINVAR